METLTQYGELHKLFDENFLDYTSYVIRERAIPDVADGLKPVQRRILQTLFNMDDGRFHKVANVVGDCMKLHPHGDASIFAALVNLANKEYLIERQGNFGNIYTGDAASAARYIECRLSPLALETLFDKNLTEYVDSYDGRMQEPALLPARLPLLLLLGGSGIAVGMATKIMPHNFVEVLQAQKAILRQEPFELYPDFLTGGLVDVTGYNQGNGRIKCRARIEEKDEKTVIIKELPFSVTTDTLIESVEKAVRAGKIRIQSINDYTAEEVEIEIKLSRNVYAADTIRALYAFTDCEVPICPNLMVIRDNRPVNMGINEILQHNTEMMVRFLQRQLEIELGRLEDKLHFLTLEQIFIEERLYKTIEECRTYETVISTLMSEFVKFLEKLVREIKVEDIERLLEIRIKRISRYDIERRSHEIKEVNAAIRQIKKYLQDMTGYAITYLDGLLKKYGPLYPRRTEILTFQEVEVRKVALSNLTMGYDAKSGFLGHHVKGDPEFSFACSEYDRLLLIFKDGMYKVINVADKLFVGNTLLWLGKVDEGITFNVIYRDGVENLSYVKRFHTPKFILDKEYRLFQAAEKSMIQFLAVGDGIRVRAYLMPSSRSKVNSCEVRFDEYLIKGVAAIGKRLASRVVRRLAPLAHDPAAEAEKKAPAGLFDLAAVKTES